MCQAEYNRQAEEADMQARYEAGERPNVLGHDPQVRRLVVERIIKNFAAKKEVA